MLSAETRSAASRPIDAVVIGGSAGGVQALLTLLPGLPASFTLPVVVLLHLPDDRESRLAEVFGYRSAMPVREARDKEPIAASTIYFAPSGFHLSIEQERTFSLSGEEPVHHSRPSIDVLMASAADVYGPYLAGILLTGASVDGAAGLSRIKQAGGLTVVQNPEQASVATMPLAAISRQAPDLVLSLEEIHELLLTLGSPT
jgi:two-component system chemotaxis response regulator CheB